jgi:hypothetical protein
MDKVIECGIRIKESLLTASDVDFQRILPFVVERAAESMRIQRKCHQTVDGAAATKSFGGITPFKGVEFYCSMKGGVEAALPFKGIECGIRIKQFAFDGPDGTFDAHLAGAMDSLKMAIVEQRNGYIAARNAKVVDFDDVSKGIELFCGVKSLCGG